MKITKRSGSLPDTVIGSSCQYGYTAEVHRGCLLSHVLFGIHLENIRGTIRDFRVFIGLWEGGGGIAAYRGMSAHPIIGGIA